MDIIAVIGISVILFYIFNEILKHNDLEPMEFSIVYIIYAMFIILFLLLPNGVKNKSIFSFK